MRTMLRNASILVAAASLAGVLSAQDPAKKPAAKTAPPDEKAMMEAWVKAATPGEAHRKLDAVVGTFDTKVRTWMDPSQPPEDSIGTSVSNWVLGNRYIEQKYEGTMMGEPFNGIGYTGYDNIQKKYIGVWMDSAGTGMLDMTGTMDAAGKVLSSKSTMWDAMTGKTTPIETKMTIVDNDHHNFELWGKAPNGKSFKMMQIEYTRKK